MKHTTAQNILNKVVEDYDNIAEDFDKTRKNRWGNLFFILPYINDADYIVDLGCGNGRAFDFLEAHKKQVKYLGIDNSQSQLKMAGINHPKAQFIHGDILKLSLESNSADKVIAIASIHHLPSKALRDQGIREAFRILKPEGLFLVTAWNLFQPKYKKFILRSRLKHLLSLGKYDARDTFIPWGETGVMRYYYAFKSKELRLLLERIGFKIVKDFTTDKNIKFVCQKP